VASVSEEGSAAPVIFVLSDCLAVTSVASAELRAWRSSNRSPEVSAARLLPV